MLLVENIVNVFEYQSKRSDEIYISSAFFSHRMLLNKWIESQKKLKILVSLRYPTDPDLLRDLLHKKNNEIQIRFLGSNFHSKFYFFRKKGKDVAAILGSSNFTNGGIIHNIETNILIVNDAALEELRNHFIDLWNTAALLSPQDVLAYQSVYKSYILQYTEIQNFGQRFQKEYIKNRVAGKKKKICKEAAEYTVFWRYVDEILDILEPECLRHFPEISPYIIIDHFWHWVVTQWDGKNRNHLNKKAYLQKKLLPNIFDLYLKWTDENYYYLEGLPEKIRFFKLKLNKINIGNLKREDAKKIYSTLNSGAMRSQRFHSDHYFVQDNSIIRIRKSLSYLLWSSDDIEVRITKLLEDEKFKLKGFGSSNIQELIGWVHSYLPMRTKKASKAVKILGF